MQIHWKWRKTDECGKAIERKTQHVTEWYKKKTIEISYDFELQAYIIMCIIHI